MPSGECPCQHLIALIDSAARIMKSSLRGKDVGIAAAKWVGEKEKLCLHCLAHPTHTAKKKD